MTTIVSFNETTSREIGVLEAANAAQSTDA